jgi:hypothetical protein
MAIVSWWGGFFGGPIVGFAIYAASPQGSLARAHGRAAAVFWALVLLAWAPFTAWIILLGGADEKLLLVGAPVVIATALFACLNGTIKARRHCTPLGRPPG